MRLSQVEHDDLLVHVFAERPREACGVILERAGERRMFRARNVQDLLRALDPAEPPATEAYTVDPTVLLEAGALVRQGWQIVVLYHSHTNGFLGFSARDQAQAAPGGRPLYPTAAYLVASVRPGPGRVAFRLAAWVWADGEFREEPVLVGASPTEILTSERTAP